MSGYPLIVRADDAGGCPEANYAIAACADAGVVQCVSVMAICPFLGDAAERLAHRTGIEFGFHFAINSEWEDVRWRPVSALDAVPSLIAADGFFRPMPSDLKAHGFSVAEALTEARAQLARIREAGFRPSYLDEHCGISHISEELETGLAALAASEGLIYEKHCRTTPVRFESASPAPPATGTIPALWVTHPGIDEPGGIMRRFHRRGNPDDNKIARERDAERRLLCDPELPAMIEKAGYELATYQKVFML